MKRVGFYVLVSLSTVLLAATVADWIHSVYWSETLILVRGPNVYAIDNFNGEVAFWRGEFRPGGSYPDGLYHEHWEWRSAKKTLEFSVENPAGGELAFAGFVLTTQRHFPTTLQQTFNPTKVTAMVAVVLPLWFLTLLFAATPACVVFRWIRGRKRGEAGLCKVCGYDLRATRDRCPECGTPITAPAVPTAS